MVWDELLTWYKDNKRTLPWRKTTNPYYILVSETMLQQTQAERVIKKYLSWTTRYPTLQSLAKAPRQEVLAEWSGLGYNSRAARIHTLAKTLVSQSQELPTNEEELKQLPGIGPYTAGAIMAFAHNKPGIFIDVNVSRVLSRTLFTRRQQVTKKKVAQELLRAQQDYPPRELGNALMDLGSTYCVAKNPRCTQCPLKSVCKTRGERKEEQQSRKKKQQTPFKNSRRWFRGAIIRELTKKNTITIIELRKKYVVKEEHEQLLTQAINNLITEEVITKNACTTLSIKE